MDGRMELVDLLTGQVIERQKPSKKAQTLAQKRALNRKLPGARGGQQGVPLKVDEEGKIWVRNADGELFQVPAGFDPSHLPCKRKKVWIFNSVTCDQIIEMVMAGHSVSQVGNMPGFPPATTILRWTSDYKDFGAEVDKARRLRAHMYHDKVMEVAEGTSKETAIEDRLKIEAYKWGAQVGDPDQFGNRIKHAGDVNAPIGFLIDTGVPINDEEAKANQAALVHSEVQGQPGSHDGNGGNLPDSDSEDVFWEEANSDDTGGEQA